MNRITKNLLILGGLIVLLGGAVTAVAMTSTRNSSKLDAGAEYIVDRSVLSIDLSESGTIKSRDQFVVKSEVEGRTSIIYVIDEGVMVKKGELLVELDSSSLEDRLVDQQIQVENSQADDVSANENLEVVKIQSRSNISRAQLDNQFAIEDKTKYNEGEWPKELMEANTEVTLAEEDFRRKSEEFDWSQKLYDEKYLSETEYRADELAKRRAELQATLAREKLKLLTNFTHTRRLAELDSDIEQKKLTLDRVNREASSDLVQAQAKLRARDAELNRQKSQLAKLEDQIAKTKIYAPADGMVVYATSAEFSWRGDTEPLKEGQEVYERQDLIHLPTADSMMVQIRIHESVLGKVKIGQPVQIKIDALPESSYTGRVTKIAPLPDAASVFMNPDLKVYDTQIMIDGVFPEIRTGMSCKAKILIAQYIDALSVPLQAVVGRNGKSVVYVIKGDTVEPRTVETGLDNDAMVHILSGLEKGERVMLAPPLGNDRYNSKGADLAEKEQSADAMMGSAKGGDAKSGRSGTEGGKAGGGKPHGARPSGAKPRADAPGAARPTRSGSSGRSSGKRP